METVRVAGAYLGPASEDDRSPDPRHDHIVLINKHYLLVAAVVAALAVLGYFLLRGQRPNAASGGRLAENAGIAESRRTDLTESRSPAGKSTTSKSESSETPSTDANVRASFRKFRRCHEDYIKYKYLTQAVDQCYASPGNKGNFISCPTGMADAQLALNSLQNDMADCGRDYNEIDRAYYEATVAAAESGDTDAQMCYVQSGFADEAVGSPPFYTDGDRSTYKATAQQYVSDAFARGDWRVVQILSVNNVGPGSGLLYLVEGAGSPDTFYKMNRLLRLGAEGQYARVLDADVRDTSPDKVAAAGAWATAMYSQHFAGSPKLTQRPTPCAYSGETAASVKAPP